MEVRSTDNTTPSRRDLMDSQSGSQSVSQAVGDSLVWVHAGVVVRILPHSSSLGVVVGRVGIQIPQVLERIQ